MVADTAGSPPGSSSLALHLRIAGGVVMGRETNAVNTHTKKKKTTLNKSNTNQDSGHLVEAEADGALQVPAGGGQLLQLVQGEAEAGAVGAGGRGAGLHHDGQLLRHGAGALGVHRASHHFEGEGEGGVAASAVRNLHTTQKKKTRAVCLLFLLLVITQVSADHYVTAMGKHA